MRFFDASCLEGEEYHSVYTLRDRNGRELTDLFEIHIIELTKQLDETNVLNDWIQLFNAANLEELDMIKTKNAGIREAMEVMRTMSFGRKLRLTYEAHLKAVRDRWAEDEYVKDLGRAEGRADAILQLLSECGEVPRDVKDRILSERDIDTLGRWLKIAAKAESIQEFREKEGI